MNFDDMKPVATATEERITDYWPGRADDRTKGMTVTGEYIGPITFDEGTDDESTLFKLRNGDKIFGVQGTAVIKRAFESISKGDSVGIRFNGKKKSEKSGRFYNDFEIRSTPKDAEVAKAEEALGGEVLSKDEFNDIPFN